MGFQGSVSDFDKPIQAFFEPKLANLGLGKSQIETQNLKQLEISLETVNNALQHPEQFGVLKIKVGIEQGKLVTVITTSSSEFNYEIGILPILLDRQRQILERTSLLEGEQKVASLRDLVKSIKDSNTRLNLEKELDSLEAKIQELSKKFEDIRLQQEQPVWLGQIEHAVQKTKLDQLRRLQNSDSETLKRELVQTKDKLQRITKQKNRYSFLMRFLFAAILVLLGLSLTFAIPVLLSWTWFLQHPRKLGLQMSGILIIFGACWAILARDQNIRLFAIGSIVIATVVGIIQLL